MLHLSQELENNYSVHSAQLNMSGSQGALLVSGSGDSSFNLVKQSQISSTATRAVLCQLSQHPKISSLVEDLEEC